MGGRDVTGMLARALWDSADDRGIVGRVFREDCDYLAGVAIEALRSMDELREFTAEELYAQPHGTVLLDEGDCAIQQRGRDAWCWAGEDNSFSSWALANSNCKYRIIWQPA